MCDLRGGLAFVLLTNTLSTPTESTPVLVWSLAPVFHSVKQTWTSAKDGRSDEGTGLRPPGTRGVHPVSMSVCARETRISDMRALGLSLVGRSARVLGSSGQSSMSKLNRPPTLFSEHRTRHPGGTSYAVTSAKPGPSGNSSMSLCVCERYIPQGCPS